MSSRSRDFGTTSNHPTCQTSPLSRRTYVTTDMIAVSRRGTTGSRRLSHELLTRAHSHPPLCLWSTTKAVDPGQIRPAVYSASWSHLSRRPDTAPTLNIRTILFLLPSRRYSALEIWDGTIPRPLPCRTSSSSPSLETNQLTETSLPLWHLWTPHR